jgi:hypothetical protein
VIQINNMVGEFGKMGVVEALAGPTDTNAFPRVLEVEDQHVLPAAVMAQPAALAPGVTLGATRADHSDIAKVRRFPRGLPVQIR